MTPTSPPEDSGDGHERTAWSMLSDDELAEVVSEALTSEGVARTESALLGGAAEVPRTERIDRLEADRRLVEMLAATGFEGERFEKAFAKLSDRLFRYAYPIMMLWVSDGTIFGECQRYRGRVDAPAAAAAAQWTESERTEAVVDSIVAAVHFFLDYALRRGKWDHRRGATLTTYFVGSCVCCFIKVCNDRWKQQQLAEAFIWSAPRPDDEGGDYLDPVEEIPAADRDPADLVADRDHARRTFSQITDDKVREGLARHMGGETQAAAAAELGLTPKAFERRLHTQRKKLRPPNNKSCEDEGRA